MSTQVNIPRAIESKSFSVKVNNPTFARLVSSTADFRLRFNKQYLLDGKCTGYFYSSPQDEDSSFSFLAEYKDGHLTNFKFYNKTRCVYTSRHGIMLEESIENITTSFSVYSPSFFEDIEMRELTNLAYVFSDMITDVLVPLL